MASNWMLVCVGAVFLIFALWGLARGFVRVMFALTASVVTIALAIALMGPMTTFLKQNTTAYSSVETFCREKLAPDIPQGTTTLKQAAIIENLPFPQALKDKLTANNNSMSYEKLGVTDFSDYISAYIAELIVRILAFIALFLLISLILRITFFTLDKAASLPGIRVANKLLGFLSGGILGLVVVWVFFLVITLFCTTSWGQSCRAQIDASPFLKTLYDQNFLLSYFTKL